MLQPRILDMFHGDNRENMPDFKTLAQVGIWGVIQKAGQGLHYLDPKYIDRTAAALDAGLLAGAYWFLDSSDGAKQADAFLNRVKPTGNFLLAPDYEKTPGNTPGLNTLYSFMQYVEKNCPGYLCVPYSSDLIRETLKAPAPGHNDTDMNGIIQYFEQHELWLAEYGPHENIPFPWNQIGKPPLIWQYSGTGHEPPIIGQVDLNTTDAPTQTALSAAWKAGRSGPKPANMQNVSALRGYMLNLDGSVMTTEQLAASVQTNNPDPNYG